MAFKNCRHCGESISDKAKTCPNCGEPQKKPNMKECISCGAEIEARLKKCPECEALQSGVVKTKQVKKGQVNSNSNRYLVIVILFLIALALYLFKDYLWNSNQKPVKMDSTVSLEDTVKIDISEGHYTRQNVEEKKLKHFLNCNELFGNLGKGILIKDKKILTSEFTDAKSYKIEKGNNANQYFISIKTIDQDGETYAEFFYHPPNKLKFICNNDSLIYIKTNS